MKKTLFLASFLLLGLAAHAQRTPQPAATYWTLEYQPKEGATYVRFYTADHRLFHAERYQAVQLPMNKRTIRRLNQQRERLIASR